MVPGNELVSQGLTQKIFGAAAGCLASLATETKTETTHVEGPHLAVGPFDVSAR